MNTSLSRLLAVLATAPAGLCAQHAKPIALRHAITDAQVVVLAEFTGERDLDERHRIRSYRTVRQFRDQRDHASKTFGVLVAADSPTKNAGPSTRSAAAPWLCCLTVDRSAAATAAPAEHGPYLRPLTAIRLADSDHRHLAETLLAAERGQPLQRSAHAFAELVLHGSASVRLEALAVLAARESLRSSLSPLERSDLLSRAVGETSDIPFKIALAKLCADCAPPGSSSLISALCMSLATVHDARFSVALGRLARRLHGNNAVKALQPGLRHARDAKQREHILLAMGATETDAALAALLRLRKTETGTAVEAALEAHGSARALEAVSRRD